MHVHGPEAQYTGSWLFGAISHGAATTCFDRNFLIDVTRFGTPTPFPGMTRNIPASDFCNELIVAL